MQLEVYIDVLFLINFIMDLLLLVIVKRLRHQEGKKYRLILGAITGAVLACLVNVCFMADVFFYLTIGYGLTGFLMTMISFGIRNKRAFISNYLVLLISSFVLGGMVNSLYLNTQTRYYLNLMYQELLKGEKRTASIAIITIITLLLASVACIIWRQNRRKEDELYSVELYIEEEPIVCKGFMDTGNSLRDPISGKPVIVVDEKLLEKELDQLKELHPNRIRVIPYSSVGKQNGLLFGIRLKKIIISNSNDCICNHEVIAALSNQGFANRETYQVLLHTDLLGIVGGQESQMGK